MRILLAHEMAGFLGGAETWVYQVASGLGARPGFECHLAFTTDAGRDRAGFTAAFQSSDPVEHPALWRRLCRRLQPDVICISNLDPDHLEAIASLDVPSVRMVHDHELSCLSGKRLYTWTGRACDRTMGLGCWACLGFLGRREGQWRLNSLGVKRRVLGLTGRLARVLVASRYMRAELLRTGIEAARIDVVAPGLEVSQRQNKLQIIAGTDGRRSRDSEKSDPVRNLQAILDHANDALVDSCFEACGERIPSRAGTELLFAGQVIRGKGLDLLIRAMAQLPNDCRLVVAGTGNALELNQTLAGKLRVADRVKFLGWVPPDQIEHYYLDADIVVVPSRWPEPFGLVGLEAMSRARPVVAFDVGGISDWLVHDHNGLLVHDVSPAALAHAIRYLAERPSLRRAMGLAGRQAFLENFTLDCMIDRLVDCFDQVRSRPTSRQLPVTITPLPDYELVHGGN